MRLKLFFLLFFWLPLFSQNYTFIHYSTENGLAQSWVNTIFQSSDGYIWIGTFDGLSRFNGQSFTNYSVFDGLANNSIVSMLEYDSLIFISHPNNLISHYNQKNQKFSFFIEFPKKGSILFGKIFEDSQHRIWLSFSRDTLFYYKNGHIQSISISKWFPELNFKILLINDIAQDSVGNLYFATNQGILVSSFNLEQWKQISVSSGLRYNSIKKLYTDSYGRIWILYNGNGIDLLLFHKSKLKIIPVQFEGLPDFEGTACFEDSNHNIWLGTLNLGLLQFSNSKQIPRFIHSYLLLNDQNGFTSASVSCILEDDEGNLWFGTSGRGAYKFPGTYFMQYTRKYGLWSDIIYSVTEDHRNRLWVSDDKGLTVFSLKGPGILGKTIFKISNKEGHFGNHISKIYEDHLGQIWLCTVGEGIYIYDGKSFNRKHLSSQKLGALTVYGIIEYNNSILVPTLGNGLIQVDPVSLHIKKIKTIQSNYLFSIFKDSKNRIWLGTFNDGYFVIQGKNIQHIQNIDNVKNPMITCFAEDTFHNIWIGTGSHGVYKYDGHVFYNFNQNNGLTNNFIFLIHSLGNYIYLGTANGLDRIDVRTNEIYHYDSHDGYSGSELNLNGICIDKHQNIWLGSIHGLIYYRNSLKHEENRSPIKHLLIEKVIAFPQGKRVIAGENLPYGKIDLHFYFNGLYYSKPSLVKYSYLLEGYQDKWSPLFTNNDLVFSGLPPGKYNLRIRASIDEGKHFTKEITFPFSIKAPFWSRMEFYLILFIVILGIVILFIYWKSIHDKKEKILLQNEIQKHVFRIQEEKKKLTEILASLKESEEKFKALTEATNAGIFIYKGTKFVYANPAVEKITGYSIQEFLRLNFWEIVHPDHREMVKERGLARIRGEYVPPSYEFKIIRKDGTVRWIEFSASHIMYEGKPAGLGTAIDITEKVEAMEKMKAAMHSYRDLFENSPDLIYVLDLDGKFIDVNSTVIQAYGYPKEKFIGRTPDFLADKTKTNMDEIIQYIERAKNGEPQRFEFWARRKDGTTFPKEVIVRREKYFGKDVLIAVARDITERVIFEQKLEEEKEWFSSTINAISDAVFTLDVHKNVFLINRVAEQMINLPFEKALGKNIDQIVHLERINPNSNANSVSFSSIVGLGNPILQNEEFRLKNNTGSEYIVMLALSKIFTDNKISGYVLVIRDITEKKRFEKELNKAEKLEALAQLASGIAHDFNNIISIISGNLELFELKVKDQSVQKYLTRSRQAIDRAKALTNQLQTFSKGGAPIRKSFNIKEVIQEMAKFILSGSSIKVHYDFASNLFPTFIDVDQISRVFQNLFINAKEAMENKGNIYIEAKNFVVVDNTTLPLPKGRYVQIHVKDDGPGIPQEITSKIFDPFFTTKTKGNGLGLSTSYSIVRRHGGMLMLDSSYENGACFIIYLPAAATEPEKRKVPESVSGKSERLDRNNESYRKKILVMDDEQEILSFVKDALETAGYSVFTSSNGEEAIQLYKEHLQNGNPMDLVILDLTIPGGMGGKETIQHLKNMNPEIKAIVFSGYTNDDTMSNFKTYGFSAYLRKPFQLQDLLQKIEKLLSDNH